MNGEVSMRRFARSITVLVVAAHGGTTKRARVKLGKTALGSVLVDARGRTLYAFGKDYKGMSACETACATATSTTCATPTRLSRCAPAHGGTVCWVEEAADGRYL